MESLDKKGLPNPPLSCHLEWSRISPVAHDIGRPFPPYALGPSFMVCSAAWCHTDLALWPTLEKVMPDESYCEIINTELQESGYWKTSVKPVIHELTCLLWFTTEPQFWVVSDIGLAPHYFAWAISKLMILWQYLIKEQSWFGDKRQKGAVDGCLCLDVWN